MMDVVLVNSKSFTEAHQGRRAGAGQPGWRRQHRPEDACVDSVPDGRSAPAEPRAPRRREERAASSSRPKSREHHAAAAGEGGGHAGAATAGGARHCRAQPGDRAPRGADPPRAPGLPGAAAQEIHRRAHRGVSLRACTSTAGARRSSASARSTIPTEARTKGIYASLQLTVGIKQNGEIESVEVNRSSGYKFLDQRRRCASCGLPRPFEPFPRDIRSDMGHPLHHPHVQLHARRRGGDERR